MVAIHYHFQLFSETTLTGGIFLFFRPHGTEERENAIVCSLLKKSYAFSDTGRQINRFSKHFRDARKKKKIEISIVIPAYNEQSRLLKTIQETVAWCEENLNSYELIIVDDGSEDDTLLIAGLLSRQIRTVRWIACPHSGKGNAVRTGMLNAAGAYVLFMDADGATPLDEIPKVLSAVKNGHDVAIGSRVVQEPKETSVITSFHRKFIGRIFAGIVNFFVIGGFADTQCGFKIFRREVVRALFSRQRINGFAFDVEILYLAGKMKLSVMEVPVNWVNQEGSKVNVVTDSVKMLIDILRISWLHRKEKFRAYNVCIRSKKIPDSDFAKH